MIVLNGYFRSQPVTGQQRYATEIADRLLATQTGVREVRPTRWARSRAVQWLDLQVRLPSKGWGGTVLSLTSRTPVLARRQVVTIHDLFPITNPEWFSPVYAELHSRLLRFHLHHAAGIAVVSQPVLEEVRDLAAPQVPVVLVPNAPTPWPGSATLAQLDRPEGGYLLAVGNLEPRKNLARLIAAHAALPQSTQAEFPLMIVGGEAAAFRSDPGFRNSAGKFVRFLGRVSDGELVKLYENATAFVSVSLAEGFGIPVVEAATLANGPLVLSDIPSYRWIGEGAGSSIIFVDPLSIESVAQGLQLAVNHGKTDTAGIRALASRFNWDESASLMWALVRSVGSM